eukprot:455571-Hanusia_phi.AAC.4
MSIRAGHSGGIIGFPIQMSPFSPTSSDLKVRGRKSWVRFPAGARAGHLLPVSSDITLHPSVHV